MPFSHRLKWHEGISSTADEMTGVSLFSKIAILGLGRMAKGLAIDLGLQGIQVYMIDLKPRREKERRQREKDLKEECESVVGLLGRESCSYPFPIYLDTLSGEAYDLVFEGLPEEIQTKRIAFSQLAKETLICSMTSTFTVGELASGIDPSLSVCVTHFMNPPYLIPFLEVVPHPKMAPLRERQLFKFLRQVGHMPIRCKSSPGFVISRLQLCLMNEAVRLMQEGVASPEDIDKAIKYGWGYRFPVMGVLEFIDVGGLEILFHAGRSVSDELNRPDLRCPDLIQTKFREGAIGTKALRGIFEYKNHEEVRRADINRLKKQVRLKNLLDSIHEEEGEWEKEEEQS